MDLSARIIVNSASSGFIDFPAIVRPFLEVMGLPLLISDRNIEQLDNSLQDHPLIVLGHNALDESVPWRPEEIVAIQEALAMGSGIVSLDPRTLELLELGTLHIESGQADQIYFPKIFHFITALHPRETFAEKQSQLLHPFSVHAVSLMEGVEILGYAGTYPYLLCQDNGAGRIVQMLGYDWMRSEIRGPLGGLDDLLWRSFIWAAKKPFVLREVPPFATLRVDDCVGDHGHYRSRPFEWVDIANRYGFRPWLGFFHETIKEAASAKMQELVKAGQATAQFHGVYLFGTVYKQNDSSVDSIKQAVQDWIQIHQWNQPFSVYFIPHNYDLSAAALPALELLGVKVIGLPYPLDSGGGASSRTTPWLEDGPFRVKKTGSDGVPWDGRNASASIYYADRFRATTDSANQLFNWLTEIRDVNGYEWFHYSEGPGQYSDTTAAMSRGIAILRRCFDSKVPGNLFTHEDSWRGKFIANITPENWETMLAGITSGLTEYEPRLVTVDEEALYVRALHTSSLDQVLINPSGQLVLQFTGEAEVPTELAVYCEENGYISRTWAPVPAFQDGLQLTSIFQPHIFTGKDTLFNERTAPFTSLEPLAYMTGIRFFTRQAGHIVKIRTYVMGPCSGDCRVQLWNMDAGILLFETNWIVHTETAGWAELPLDSPLYIFAHIGYIVAVSGLHSLEDPTTFSYPYHPVAHDYPLTGHFLYAYDLAGIKYEPHAAPSDTLDRCAYYRDVVFVPIWPAK